MSNTVRATLPGYNALTDTNLDHYSLYADVDNVLIKRKQTGSGTVAAAGGPGYTIDTIPHNLGYIPFFTVYAKYQDLYQDNYKLLNNQFNAFSVPSAVCAADTTNLYVVNLQAVTMPYAYDIFYDDMDTTGTPSITESEKVFKVARPGKNALTSRNPNDYIMHSDLNNFKILKQATTSKVLAAGDNSIAHGMTLNTPYKFFCFIKFPDGKTLLTGNAIGYSYDKTKWVMTSMDGTNIHITSSGAFTVNVTYVIYGSATDGSINNAGNIIAVAKEGSDVLTETNPDNFNFHSNYATLKYYESGKTDYVEIDDNNYEVIPHNLGYVPFFIGFINDLNSLTIFNGNSERSYAIAPCYSGRSTLLNPDQDIAAYVYADDTNIYLNAYFDVNAIGTGFFYQFYYKIFKNNLGL